MQEWQKWYSGGVMRGISLLVCAVMVGAAFGAMAPALGLDPLDPKDAMRDNDGDGLSNLQEYLMGCDPYNPDSDWDDLPDGWEGYYRENPAMYDYDGDGRADRTFVGDVIADYLFDPANALDAFEDPDDDGLTNLQEYGMGTDPSNPNTDGDRWIKDSEDPEPLIPDADYKAVFGGSIFHPYLGPLSHGRGAPPVPSAPANAPGALATVDQGQGKAPVLSLTMSSGVAGSGNGAGRLTALWMAAGSGGRALKYITRVIVDSELPSVIMKGQPFTISGHVETTTVQVDDGSGTGGNSNNNGQNNQNNGQNQQPGSNPGNPNPGQNGPGGNNGQNQQPGGNPGNPQPGNCGNTGGTGDNPGFGNGGQGHGDPPWGGGSNPGQGGQDGPGMGDQGGDKPLFYWYWWHGPLNEGGRSSGRAGEEWYPIDQTMDIAIQLNTSRGNYGIGCGKADQLVDEKYGYFTITCIIPGAAPGGEGKVAIHALSNSNYAGSWWEEGRDG